MREIKFRGRRVDSGEWVYGDLVHNAFDGHGIFPVGIQTPGCYSEEVDPETVGQFTGLHDKNGKEIYEGDILRHGHGDCRGAIVQVIYQAPSFIMKEKPKHKTWYTFILSPEQNQFEEIIGNIHENPELLNVR